MREYETEHKLNSDEDCFQSALTKFWQSRALKYPMLFSVYKFIGAVPATATPCKRVFSKSGFEVTERGNRLGTEKVKAIMFLKENDSH